MAQAIGIDESQFSGSTSIDHSSAVAIRQRPREKLIQAGDEKSVATSSAIGIRVKKSIGPVCRPGCQCLCHSERKSQTSGYLDGVVGRLFLGYSGLPLLNSRCDSSTC